MARCPHYAALAVVRALALGRAHRARRRAARATTPARAARWQAAHAAAWARVAQHYAHPGYCRKAYALAQGAAALAPGHTWAMVVRGVWPS
jgi:hypothetical protein